MVCKIFLLLISDICVIVVSLLFIFNVKERLYAKKRLIYHN